jgi:hypothetical protein
MQRQEGPTMTTYFADTMREPPLLLRQVRDERGITDEAYLDGVCSRGQP